MKLTFTQTITLGFASLFLVGCTPDQTATQPSNQDTSMINTGDTENKDSAQVNPVMESETASDQSQQTRYQQYSPAVLANAANTRRVLFFYANWCPTCKPADADFSSNSIQIPSDVTLIRVNYNDNETDADEKALAKQYNITYQHTYVQIDQNGKEITKWNGGQLKELLKNVQ